jgi:hypothetical protein
MSVQQMKPIFQQQETRTECVFRHTRQMLHDTRVSMEAFAQVVVELYHAAVPTAARDIQFRVGGDLFKCAAANAQKLRRYMDDDINARLPVDLEEAWVNGLSEPYRNACIRDLARRYGLLAVQAPGTCAISDMQTVSKLSREFGEALEALSPMLDNGKFGEEDAPLFERAARELEELLAAGEGVLARIRNHESLKARASATR